MHIDNLRISLKQKKLLTFFACTSLILTSCFKDEPLNAECDIWQAYVSIPDPTTMFFSAADTIAKLSSAENVVVFSPRASADLTAVALNFVITDGATIEPANGSVQDFSQGPVEYIVTSQDGAWSRIYSVKFNRTERTFTDTVKFDFEHTYLGSNSSGSTFFYYWTDLSTNGDTLYNWATGNAGFAISQSKADKMDYPSVPIEDGFDGRAVRLTTSATGALASMMSMPIAAGNLFIGKFLSENALKDPMGATRFGLPTDVHPVLFEGWYKYKPGEKYRDRKGSEVKDKVDQCSIYTVLYRNTDADGQSVTLQGDNVLSSELIVARAVMEEIPATEEWTHFSIPFVYVDDKELDSEILEQRGYNMAVVFSSSSEGDNFEGAIGSELCIDKVRIIQTATER